MAKQFYRKKKVFKTYKPTLYKTPFARHAGKMKVLRRRFEFDLAVISLAGRASLQPFTQLSVVNVTAQLSADQEFVAMQTAYSFLRFTGISIEFCPMSNNKPPINAMIYYRKLLETDVTAQTVPSEDDSLQCLTGTNGDKQIKYYPCRHESFQNDAGFTIGGPVWTSAGAFLSSNYWITLAIGQQIQTGEDANYGVLRVKCYLEYCSPFQKS